MTDGQTDKQAIAYTRYSIYAVARKNGKDYSDAVTNKRCRSTLQCYSYTIISAKITTL